MLHCSVKDRSAASAILFLSHLNTDFMNYDMSSGLREGAQSYFTPGSEEENVSAW
jgi:hypothetical protein